jgi:hypothetical protein
MGNKPSRSANRKQDLIKLLRSGGLLGEVSQADADLRYGEVNFMQLGWTLIHLAVWSDQAEVVQHLLKLGFDANVGDVVRAKQHGHTPLKLAQLLRHNSVCTILGGRGSEVKESPVMKHGDIEATRHSSCGSSGQDKNGQQVKRVPANTDERASEVELLIYSVNAIEENSCSEEERSSEAKSLREESLYEDESELSGRWGDLGELTQEAQPRTPF